MNDSLIHIRQLRKSYTEGAVTRRIFEHLDLTFEAAEFIALVGRSGSGKSTLLNLLSGIDLPDAGDIQINNIVINLLDEQQRTRFRRRHIGFVFQFFNLIPTLTVQENIFLPLELNDLHHLRPQALALLEEVGLGQRRSSFPEHLSGGEQQRVACIRALVHQPLLLLADEPTGNLDTETGTQVLDLLMRLHRQVKTTLVMVTHSREVAARADRVFLLDAGQVRDITASLAESPA